jgi:hypothetical protein
LCYKLQTLEENSEQHFEEREREFLCLCEEKEERKYLVNDYAVKLLIRVLMLGETIGLVFLFLFFFIC